MNWFSFLNGSIGLSSPVQSYYPKLNLLIFLGGVQSLPISDGQGGEEEREEEAGEAEHLPVQEV